MKRTLSVAMSIALFATLYGCSSPSPAPAPSPTSTTPSASPAKPAVIAGLLKDYSFDTDPAKLAKPPEVTVNNVSWTTDRFGKSNSAYHFNGEDSRIDYRVNINPDVMPKLTITAWARPTTVHTAGEGDLGSHTVISHNAGDFQRTLLIDSRGGGLGWSAFGGDAEVLGSSQVQAGKWTFLAVVYDQDKQTVALYVNNTKVFEKPGKLSKGADYVRIGGQPGLDDYFFIGDIDDVKLYSRALSEAEVQSIFKQG